MKDDNKDKYSEEIQDIVDRMPTEWTFRVAIALIVLVLSLVTLSFIIKYPDTIRGEITVTAEAAPVRVVAILSFRRIRTANIIVWHKVLNITKIIAKLFGCFDFI